MIESVINKINQLDLINGNIKGISTYHSLHQQNLLNVPILKPLLILVLSGNKVIGSDKQITCGSGGFIFFTPLSIVNMRNIPANSNYLALLIEFAESDFDKTAPSAEQKNPTDFTVGTIDNTFYQCLLQFLACLEWAPDEVITSRRQELIRLLISSGYGSIMYSENHQPITTKVINILKKHGNTKMTLNEIGEEIFMSESTLYRKLRSEGESIQQIKDNVIMAEAIHLLQTTTLSIDNIAEKCGYSSVARFSQRFKSHFGLSAKELRKTQSV